MIGKTVAVVLLLVGLVNGFPLVGVLSGAKLQALYGVPIEDPNLLILLRHRAVLFGLLGGFIIAAAFIPAWREAAMVVALVSMLSFIALAYAQGSFNPAIRKLVMVDVVLSLALITAFVLQWASRQTTPG